MKALSLPKNPPSAMLVILLVNGTLFGQGGWTDDGSVVRFTTSTDKVGIGTSSPGTDLHVLGTETYIIHAQRSGDPAGKDYYRWYSSWGPVEGGISADASYEWNTNIWSTPDLTLGSGGRGIFISLLIKIVATSASGQGEFIESLLITGDCCLRADVSLSRQVEPEAAALTHF